MQIATEQLVDRLQPILGDFVVYRTPLCHVLSQMMSGYQLAATSFPDMAKALEREIFRGLYSALGEKMTVIHPSGETRRIRMSQMEELADEVLGVWMDNLPVTAYSHGVIKEYAMTAGSVAAMRTLLTKYREFDPLEERALMIRLLRDGYPAHRTCSWLPQISGE